MTRWLFVRLGRVGHAAAAIVLTSGVFYMSACAFGDRHLNLEAAAVSVKSASWTGPPDNDRVISVARPNDLRRTKDHLGNIRNGYGVITSHVRSNNDVPLWVTNSIIDCLAQAGYTVNRVESVESSSLPVAVEVTLLVAEVNDGGGSPPAWLQSELAIFKNGRRVYRKAFVGRAKTGAFLVTAGDFQQMFNEALQDLLTQALPDVTASLYQTLAQR